ncbi:MAG: ATP-dependent DNA helicase RecG [Alphaproteobacteria bacterium]|nr:MAG: ATP-dependent DNA helicase RecG [Alphaproteobacteria bacterium]
MVGTHPHARFVTDEVLHRLFAPLQTLPKVGIKTAETLHRLDIFTPRDLLFHLPTGVQIHRVITTPTFVSPGESIILPCTVIKHPTGFSRLSRRIPAKVLVESPLGLLQLVFFQGFPSYIKSQFPLHQTVVIAGTPERVREVWQITHPTVMPSQYLQKKNLIEAIYPLTQGLRATVLRNLIQHVLGFFPWDNVRDSEWLNPDMCAKHNWPLFGEALWSAHHPVTLEDCSSSSPARKRLAFDEALMYQYYLQNIRATGKTHSGYAFVTHRQNHIRLLEAMPFALTSCQETAITEIHNDMAKPYPMRRLLHGDVGSGKTAVAAATIMQALSHGKNACLLSPTEILTKQHIRTFQNWFFPLGIRVHGVTGKTSHVDRSRILATLVDSPGSHIVIGTHALLHDDAWRASMGVVVIDEQHRFGVRQRMQLLAQTPSPDVLMMSATPIPRTMLLTVYGDLKTSALKTKPQGRKDVETRVMSCDRIHTIIEKLGALLRYGEKIFWVCPLVEESEHMAVIDVHTRYAILATHFGEEAVSLLHGRMKPEDKDSIFLRFSRGESKILVATSVIEVGVDVPDANVLIIENAERYGLAQLHQLRGRVGRGNAQAVCILLYGETVSATSMRRLTLLRTCFDGFALAEEDLKLRQGGDVIGTQQSGSIRFRILNPEEHLALMIEARALLANETPPQNQRDLWQKPHRDNQGIPGV